MYFTATKDSPVHIQGYRVRSDGKRLERITEIRKTKRGKRRPAKTVKRSHRIVFNDDFSYFHGTKDDNVHLANTLQLAYALQKAGKPFEMMVYPKSRHGVGDSRQALHLRQLMTQFFLDNL